jgi:hypothetical protein
LAHVPQLPAEETNVTQKYLRDLRHTGAVAEIARVKFPFPGPEHPDYDTIVNEPTPNLAVGKDGGRDLFPNIVVVRRPGQWLLMMAEVETAESVTDESAQTRWLPFSKCGDLLIYVPAGYAPEAKRLCKRYGVKPMGIRTWRFRPVWGLDVSEA